MKIIILVAVTAFVIACQPVSKKEVTTNGSFSDLPATNWRDALVSGNGEMGIMVFGTPQNEKIIFNHEFLYEFLGTEDVEPANISGVMPQVKQLIKAEKYHEAKALTLKEAFANGHPDLLWTDPYHPACALHIQQDFEGEVSGYKRTTEYETGEIRINWFADNIAFTRTSFVSRPDNVIASKIEADKDEKINTTLFIAHQLDKEALISKEWNAGFEKNIKILHPDRIDKLNTPLIEEADNNATDKWLTFRVKYQVYNRGYEVVVLVRNDGGSVTSKDNKIHVQNANSLEIYARVIPVEPFSNSKITDAKKEIKKLDSFVAVLKKHAMVHREMYNRVSLHLDKTGFKDGSNETLLANQKEKGEVNPYLLEKVFNMGIYGLISSSGKNPPNLMGIWNGEWRPRWSGDFTTDANVNLQIAGANLANLPEAIDGYMSMLERIAPDWEVNAKNLYGCRGYLAGTRTSGRRNFHTHYGKFPGHYWTAGASWLLLPCYEYYQCSGDKDFLLNRLLPMMKKTALFYEDFLDTYDENGKYLFAPSYSPENEAILPDESRQAAVANATMDIAVVRELLTNLIRVSKELNLQEEKIDTWKEMLTKLPPYLINEDGALKEWAHPGLYDNYNHRHISHLYPVWPGLEFTPDDTILFKAAKIAIEKRGRGNGSAHGLAHTALIATRLKNATLVYGNLLYLMKNDYLYNSLVTSHNPGIIYNTDALHSIPAVIMEMLVYSRPGVIELLPACSKKLAKGSIKGITCRTQARVDELNWDFTNKRITAKISSLKDQEVRLILPESFKEATVKVNNIKLTKTGERAYLLNLNPEKPAQLIIH